MSRAVELLGDCRDLRMGELVNRLLEEARVEIEGEVHAADDATYFRGCIAPLREPGCDRTSRRADS
jgi:hypothetical protein